MGHFDLFKPVPNRVILARLSLSPTGICSGVCGNDSHYERCRTSFFEGDGDGVSPQQ